MWSSVIHFAINITVEIGVVLALVSVFLQVIKLALPAHKLRTFFSSKGGYVAGIAFGSLTPFCSVTTIPILRELLRAQAGFGPSMAFLFVSPLVNPLIFTLITASLGLKVAVAYTLLAVILAVLFSWLLEKFHFSRFVITSEPSGEAITGCRAGKQGLSRIRSQSIGDHCIEFIAGSYRSFVSFIPYLLLGVGLATLMQAFVPKDFIVQTLGHDHWYTIILASVVGAPLYIRVSTLFPLISVFLKMGMSSGVAMSFIIGSSGISVPEIVLLKSLFRYPLVLTFILVVVSIAIISGLTVNLWF
ncbi:permease [Dongshaea marina]|uniref:permease n=1 Tax=Dongshaea marina TaxID=2047966 RepID=UPI000D3E1F79|nr:permease [Dongshaea marina]